MPPRRAIPSYEHHKPSGRAYMRVPIPGGKRKAIYLGAYNSAESKSEYRRIIAELDSGGTTSETRSGLSVDDVLDRYMAWAAKHYRGPDGRETSELDEMRRVIVPLSKLYGGEPAASFGPLALKAVRQAFIAAGNCRKLVNKRTGRVRRIFKWAASEEFVPVEVFSALATVAGLQKGRTTAPESRKVTPVDPRHVEAVKARVSPEVAAMIEIQELAAMRPQDVCGLTLAELDCSGAIWVYRPAVHKNSWRDKPREVLIGPRAQKVLAPFLEGLNPSERVFSPKRARKAYLERLRAARKTPVQPSHMNRRKAKPKRTPGDAWNTRAYAHAIARACRKAGIAVWGPNRLRHRAATDIRRKHGLEAVQAALGHEQMQTSEIYAGRLRDLAEKVAKER